MIIFSIVIRNWLEKCDSLVASLVGLGSFMLYVFTLSLGVEGGDPGEFQFVPYVLGIPHRTGYPLYILLGKLWGYLPVGSVAYRMNLFSALFAALAVCLTYLVIKRLGASPLAALGGAASLALSSLFWSWATMAGVRAMNAFFFALLIWLALVWRAKTRSALAESQRWLYGLVLAFGFSLTHHRTALLALPALAIFVFLEGLRDRRTVMLSLLLIVLPSLLYLYLPIRGRMDPLFANIPVKTLADFIDLVGSTKVADRFHLLAWTDILPRLWAYVENLHDQFTWPLVFPGFLGFLLLARKDLKAFLFLALMFFSVVGFTMSYYLEGRPGIEDYFLPSYLVFALWIGLSLDGLLKVAERPRASLWRFCGVMTILFASVLLLWWEGKASYATIRQSRQAPLDGYRQALRGEQAERFALSSLSLVEPGAVILSDWEQATPLLYYQLVEKKRPDIIVHYPLGDWKEWLTRLPGRPIYITRHFPPLVGMRNLTSVGPLVRLQDSPSLEIPSDITFLKADFEGEMELVGYLFIDGWEKQRSQPLGVGDILQVLLYWRALTTMEGDYSISLRLLDQNGSLLGQVDNANPVLSLYPTHLWSEGEVVGDYYELPLPGKKGLYHLEVLVYTKEKGGGFRNLVVAGSEPPLDRVILEPFFVE